MVHSLWQPQRLALVLALIVLTLIAGACGEDKKDEPDGGEEIDRDPQTPIVIPAEKPLIMGLSLPLTGPDRALGAEERDAAVVAIERWKEANGDRIKGHEIQVRVEDDGCTEADISVQAAERFLRTEGLVGVIGPSCSAGAAAAIPVYNQAGIVTISAAATETDLTAGGSSGGFFFRTAYRSDLQGAFIGIFASAQLQAQRAYLVDDGELYGQDLADKAQQAMEASEVRVTRESVQRGTVDFTEVATRITQANPAFVGFAGFNPEATLLYRQLRDAGYTGLFGAGDAAASLLTFVEPVGAEAAEGVLFVGCSLALPEDFVTEFKQIRGHEPEASSFLPQTFDAMIILLDAVAEVAERQEDGSLAIDPMALRDAVRATTFEDGLSGPGAFDENGDRVPHAGDTFSDVVDAAVAAGDIDVFLSFGLVPCQVQDGRLVNLLGPGAGELRLP